MAPPRAKCQLRPPTTQVAALRSRLSDAHSRSPAGPCQRGRLDGTLVKCIRVVAPASSSPLSGTA